MHKNNLDLQNKTQKKKKKMKIQIKKHVWGGLDVVKPHLQRKYFAYQALSRLWGLGFLSGTVSNNLAF